MSTILDALRKVEEEKRIQMPDVKTRLLSTTPRFDFRTPHRSRPPWVIGSGLALAGIAIGAGVMLWGFSNTAAVKEDVTPQQSASLGQSEQGQVQPVPPQPLPPQIVQAPQPRPIPPSPVVPSPVVASPPPNVAAPAPAYNPSTSGLTPEVAATVTQQQQTETPQPAAGVIQRSPFVNSSPYDRIVASPPVPPPNVAPREASAPRAIVRRSPAQENNNQPPPAAAIRNALVEKETAVRPASPPAAGSSQTAGAPPGASLSFLQWSADPEKRVASIKVGTGPATIAHEGDSIDGLTIVKIRPDAVELRSGDSNYVLKAR